jgi:D-lyxose ketol-isomerase
MMVRVNQVTPIHFHWKKMEDIINRGGGTLCMKLWKANEKEEMTQEPVYAQIDGVTTIIHAGEVKRLTPGQSISFEPYMYHMFWAEEMPCLVGEVSTVNDDVNDNRFYEPLGRFPQIEEDLAPKYLLCNETHMQKLHPRK